MHLIAGAGQGLARRGDGRGPVVGGHMCQSEQAARRQGVAVVGDDAARAAFLGHEVEHRDHQQPDRPAQVEQPGDLRGLEHRLGLTDVRPHDRGVVVTGDDHLGVCDGHLVAVHIDHAAVRIGPLGDLVHVSHGRDARAEVEELGDAFFDHEQHRPAQEGPVPAGLDIHVRKSAQHPVGRLPVDREVVAAAQQVVVDTGGAGFIEVDPVRRGRSRRGHQKCPLTCVHTIRTHI
jgi:hypothetical protein